MALPPFAALPIPHCPPQASVWGSGIAGAACAALALATGQYDFWQVCVCDGWGGEGVQGKKGAAALTWRCLELVAVTGGE